MTLVDEMAVYTETVQDDVVRLFARLTVAQLFAGFVVEGDQAVLTELIQTAEALDQPLCPVAHCWTPFGLTYRSCCDTYVCDDHQPEHDEHCAEFVAQLREDTF